MDEKDYPFDMDPVEIDYTPMFLDMAHLNEKAVKKYVSSFDLKAKILSCRACPLNAYQKTLPFTNFDASFMVITEQPNDVSANSEQGQLLMKALQEAGFDLNDIYFTSSVKCQGSMDYEQCHMHLISELIIVQPQVILGLGYHAVHLLVDNPFPGKGVTLINGSDLLVSYSLSEVLADESKKQAFFESLYLVKRRLQQRLEMYERV